MPHQSIEVTVPKGEIDRIIELADREGVDLTGVSAIKGPQRTLSFLTTNGAQQPFLDDLQRSLHKTEDWKIAILPVSAVIRKKAEEEEEASTSTEAREALLAEASANTELTPTFAALVVISAIVAALGMIEDNISAIIGAMVIAPLLGPLLGSILGVTLGERRLIGRSARTGAVGILLAIGVGAVLGLVLSFDPSGPELTARATVGYDTVALALAAGAAAAMSMTAGVASILVGVMVAVALMPPATAIGLFVGKAAWPLAGNALLLLAVNLAAVQFSGQIVFLIRGVRPRTRYRQAKVKNAIRLSLIVSGALLLALILLIGFQLTR